MKQQQQKKERKKIQILLNTPTRKLTIDTQQYLENCWKIY